ncbi:sulfotransferase family 2 domain-containing protein [Bacillus sp. EB600]|uniref:sulfotransferase family 2 domain-containing protein n=1 Tax=Bacillus sp. EB600 TaxID=2806345 RepID=UPI00210CC7BB|nr:sulfotransferase family 2 domain-containing protein [Bacillus sp. EB600]MCQ6282351.1 sulfotransferase family 2 domain-containing protein [Bacillus sp. EB600]
MDKSQKYEDHVLIFMHIPKTAGITLRSIIKNQYMPEEVINTFEHDTGFETIEYRVRTENIKCLLSHHPFGIHKLVHKPFTYVTMLRDPVDRVISAYYYLHKNTDTLEEFKKKIDNVNLKEFVTQDDKDFQYFVNNMQTRIVSGEFDPKRANLNKAKDNFRDYFSVIGITEMFDESMNLMKEKFNWGDIHYTKQNVTKKRPLKENVPEEIIKLIEEKNQLDLELYRWVKENLQN